MNLLNKKIIFNKKGRAKVSVFVMLFLFSFSLVSAADAIIITSTFIPASQEPFLDVNSSTWWAGLINWSTSWFFESPANVLEFNETKLNKTIDARTVAGAGDITAVYGVAPYLSTNSSTTADPYVDFDESRLNVTINSFLGNGTFGQSGGNVSEYNSPFFTDINVTNILYVLGEAVIDMFRTGTTSFPFNFYDDGNNLILNATTIGGSNYFGINTAGAFLQLYANPGPANDDLMFSIAETQGATTEINFYEGGVGNNRIWSSGSVRVGGEKESTCDNITTWVDCDTAGTGADLVVQDDVAILGKLFVSDQTNLTLSESDPHFTGNLTLYNNTHWSFTFNLTTNNTLTTYVNAQDVIFNQTMGTYVLAKAGGFSWAEITNGTNMLQSTFNTNYTANDAAYRSVTNATYRTLLNNSFTANANFTRNATFTVATNYTNKGVIRNFGANGCKEISNATGIFWIC